MLREIIKVSGKTKNKFFLKGDKPELEIDSGMHGDEGGIINSVKIVLADYLLELPSLLFIPEVSPSAIGLGTRTNAQENDINRVFLDGTQDIEAQLIMETVGRYKFKKSISFHEDPKYFYIYDAGDENLEGTKKLESMREEIELVGAKLLDGADDEGDVALGNLFSRGYKYFQPETQNNRSGFFGSWALSKGVTQRALTVEVPVGLTSDEKKKVVDIVFKHLVK